MIILTEGYNMVTKTQLIEIISKLPLDEEDAIWQKIAEMIGEELAQRLSSMPPLVLVALYCGIEANSLEDKADLALPEKTEGSVPPKKESISPKKESISPKKESISPKKESISPKKESTPPESHTAEYKCHDRPKSEYIDPDGPKYFGPGGD